MQLHDRTGKTINIPEMTLNIDVSDEEMAARKRDLKEMLAEEGIWPIEEKILKGAWPFSIFHFTCIDIL